MDRNIPTGTVVENLIINNIQIEKGSTPSEYKPFGELEKISIGKNKFSKNNGWDEENGLFNWKGYRTNAAWGGVYFDLADLCSKNNLKIGDEVTCSIYFTADRLL